MDDTKHKEINGPALVNRIDSLLQQKLLSRQQLADACGFSVQNIARWKTLGSLPDLSVGIKLAEYLGVSLYWLITGQKEFEEKNEDANLLSRFRILNNDDKEVILACLNALTKKYVKRGFEGIQEITD